ncbi:MAG: DUF6263 family protein [Planctomycetes bacterium]|nr:DUF6263 family protein [Planctomycetota bacterium]
MSPRTFLFPLFLIAAPLFAQGEVDLRTAAKKGSSVWLLQTMKQEQNIDMAGQQMEMGNNVSRTLQVTVKDVDDKGNLVVETKLVRIQGAMTMPMMGDVEFDSAAPAEGGEDEDDGMGGMTGQMTKAMVAGAGKTFTALVSPNGKVLELMDDAKELLKGSKGGAMGAGLDEGALKQMVRGAFGDLPEKPTAVGAKWKDTDMEQDGRMPMKRDLELALAACNDDQFEITSTGTLTQGDMKDDAGEAGDEQEAQAREMMKSMKLKNGKATGSLKVSRKDGFVVESNNVVSFDAEIADGPMGEMQMSIKVTTSTKRTTEAEAAPKKAAAKEDTVKEETVKEEAGKQGK